MNRQLGLRALICALGVVVAAWGVWTLLTTSRLDQLLNAALWLGGGIATHDAVIAPATILLGALLVPRLPEWARGAVAAGFIVVGTLTVAAIPVLGAWGRRPDNPTLLPRDYWLGWLLVVGSVAVVSTAAAVLSRSKGRTPRQPQRHSESGGA